MYKGYMDKAKGGRFKGGRQGWVGWGENGDNWTGTTIKKMKKTLKHRCL